MTERSTPGTGERKTSKSSFFGSIVDIIYCWMAGENTLLYRAPFIKRITRSRTQPVLPEEVNIRHAGQAKVLCP
ncbi:hypothetical protein Mpsy_1840 [Methanolobus psychrophilus R15]|nr:hypothetical protein Mpsy_1840 [Methanolobus psychrophilus R15]